MISILNRKTLGRAVGGALFDVNDMLCSLSPHDLRLNFEEYGAKLDKAKALIDIENKFYKFKEK